MKLTIRLFARARDLVGAETLMVELPALATVAVLRSAIMELCPALRELLPRCAIAVNEDFATDDVRIVDQHEIAIIPPVSGG